MNTDTDTQRVVRNARQIVLALRAIADTRPDPLGSYYDQLQHIALLASVARAALAVAVGITPAGDEDAGDDEEDDRT